MGKKGWTFRVGRWGMKGWTFMVGRWKKGWTFMVGRWGRKVGHSFYGRQVGMKGHLG